MADHSKIEWTNATWNPIRALNQKTGKVGWYCEHATTGCEFCYAESMNKRLGTGFPFKPGHRKDVTIFLDETMLQAPLRWRQPRMIFVCSMTDLFAEFVKDEWIDKIFAVMARCPQHTFQLLSKRSGRMRDYCLSSSTIDRVAALVYGSKYEQGTDHPLQDSVRGIGNRRGGADLASQKASRETAQQGERRIPEGGRVGQLRQGESGISDPPRLPSDCDNDRWPENRSRGPSSSLDALQRSDTGRSNHQSQERGQGRQSPEQHGVGDDVGTEDPCNPYFECKPQQAEGSPSSENASHRGGRFEDEKNAGNRHDGENDCGDLRDEAESGVRHMYAENLAAHLEWPLKNVWLGVSCERQQEVDERIPLLLQTPAAVRFVSLEPLLGPIDLRSIPFTSGDPRHRQDALTGEALMYGTGVNGNPDMTIRMTEPKLAKVSWCIVGGESGPNARPMHPDWPRLLRDQCAAAGVAYFFKQHGEWLSCTDDNGQISYGGHKSHLWGENWGGDGACYRVGKKAAGRLLDGVEHNGFPVSP